MNPLVQANKAWSTYFCFTIAREKTNEKIFDSVPSITDLLCLTWPIFALNTSHLELHFDRAKKCKKAWVNEWLYNVDIGRRILKLYHIISQCSLHVRCASRNAFTLCFPICSYLFIYI